MKRLDAKKLQRLFVQLKSVISDAEDAISEIEAIFGAVAEIVGTDEREASL